MLSALSMFNIGVGPSSSHTLGPMKAGKRFVDRLQRKGLLRDVDRIVLDLYGSLSLTGRGHLTDQAVMLGLAGMEPETVDIDYVPQFMKGVAARRHLPLAGGAAEIPFSRDLDILFHDSCLPLHENGMRLTAFSADAAIDSATYYSTGGGVVLEPGEFGRPDQARHEVPYPFCYASDLLRHCEETGFSIPGLILANELTVHTRDEILAYCRHIWDVMRECADRGMHTEGVLPGSLRLHRRAPGLYRRLTGGGGHMHNPMLLLDWVNMFALAVSEENAAGGRVVTAPTNGACGVVPAVMLYYDKFVNPLDDHSLARFFLASGAIGLLFRNNASISGAEVGCQGEVGVACSMAAAGLAELLGATPLQVCTAAEIAIEHNLGLTCDPVDGLVQIPCIERNAINSVKALNAARMAMERTCQPTVSLDSVIEAMLATGKDMHPKYRETAQGGLATVSLGGCG